MPVALRSCTHRLVVLLLLASATLPLAHAAQTHPWRIGVGGDLPTGFMGALSIYGLPHEAILDSEMTSAAELAKFQIVILSRPSYGAAEVSAAVEQYVRNGGCAVYEYPCMPSEAMIAGRRLPPAKGPGMLYESGSPVTAGLTDAILTTDRAGGEMASIIPTDEGVQVLTRFTDRDAKKGTQGKFLDGERGAPAILMARYGKGKVVWSGVRLSICAAFDDNRHIAPFIAGLVRELSAGEVTPRFLVQTEPIESDLTEPRAYPCTPRLYTPQDEPETPQGVEVVDDDADAVAEYDLFGKVVPGTAAIVYLSYHSPRWYRAVRFDGKEASIVRVDAGKQTTLRAVPLPAAKAWLNVMVRRRWGSVVVDANGAPLISACDGEPLRGVVAGEGLLDVGYQPVCPVEFADGFTRTAEEPDPWQAATGAWQMVQAEGDPTEAANPFRYQGVSAAVGKPAIATAGAWFWDNYSAELSVLADSAACGVVGHYLGPDRFILVRLATPADAPATVSVIQRTPAGDTTLASARVQAQRQRWYKLGLRATAGLIDGVLDGKVVVQARDKQSGYGAVGLYVEGGKAQFDDVRVTPWHGTQPAVCGWGPWEWEPAEGVWDYDAEAPAGGALQASAPSGASALSPADDYGDGRFEVELRPAPGAETGVLVRHRGEANCVFAGLTSDQTGKATAVVRQTLDGRERIVASAGLPDGARQWHRLSLTTVGHRLDLSVDGRPLLQTRAAAGEHGAVGLHVRGGGAFRNWSFMPLPRGDDVNDTPTPGYAGIIDRNSWAGRAGAWQSDPTALDTFWHVGFFPHDVELRLGVYRDGADTSTTQAMLAPRRDPGDGYILTAAADWTAATVRLELSRAGQTVAAGTATLPEGADRYCLHLRREAGLLVAGIDGKDGPAYDDPNSLTAPELGFRMAGAGPVRPDDIRVASRDLRNHTFDAAPTDWFIHSGQWELTSRWPCTPGWAWFSGVSKQDALIRTKARFVGDQEVQFYAGAKALPSGEAMRDIIVGLCGGDDPSQGYRFTIESHSGGTFLSRNGEVVARAEGFVLSQAAIHFDWTSFAAARVGNKVSLQWWGRTILEYEDPAPLEGGYVWLGTYNNGISIPRVTIYGREQ